MERKGQHQHPSQQRFAYRRTLVEPLMCASAFTAGKSTAFFLVEQSNQSTSHRLRAGECAQIAERLKKAIGSAATGTSLQQLVGVMSDSQTVSANTPGYEGDVEMH